VKGDAQSVDWTRRSSAHNSASSSSSANGICSQLFSVVVVIQPKKEKAMGYLTAAVAAANLLVADLAYNKQRFRLFYWSSLLLLLAA